MDIRMEIWAAPELRAWLDYSKNMVRLHLHDIGQACPWDISPFYRDIINQVIMEEEWI